MKNLTIVFIFVLLSCNEKISTICTIDIEQGFYKAQEILISDFAEHLEYVVLESKKPIDRNLKVYSSGDYLICMAYRQIYLFDRHTGKFIKEIGTYGNGPGEYNNSFYFDSETQQVIASRMEGYLGYDLNGKPIRTMIKPKHEDEGGTLSTMTLLDKNMMVYYYSNSRGYAKDRLLIVDEYGEVSRTFSHFESFVPQVRVSQVIPPVFYHYGKNTMFLEFCVDTIYQITKDALFPQYHISMGKYKPPYEKQCEMFLPPNPLMYQYFWFRNFGETDRLLFFDFTHKKANSTDSSPSSFFGYYDKKIKTVKIADVDKNRRRIKNNIDYFVDIQFSSWTINHEKNEMVSYIDAIDVVNWFQQNHQKVKKLPSHFKKLSTLKEDDDPIVVIAKLK